MGQRLGDEGQPSRFRLDMMEEVLDRAKQSAEVTRDHPEGIKGAQADASAVFPARTGKTKEEIKDEVETTFGYHHYRPLDVIRPKYEFHVSCLKSVPQAVRAILESGDFEDANRRAISIGGDSDTIACMAGEIAQAFYGGVPEVIGRRVLDDHRGVVTRAFMERHACP